MMTGDDMTEDKCIETSIRMTIDLCLTSGLGRYSSMGTLRNILTVINMNEQDEIPDVEMDRIYDIAKSALLESGMKVPNEWPEDIESEESRILYQHLMRNLLELYGNFDDYDYRECVTLSTLCAMSALYRGDKEDISEEDAELFADSVRYNVYKTCESVRSSV